MSCFIIAEAGVNHNGSEELALRLIEAAANTGVDAVKFQSFRAETLVRRGAKKAEYQRDRTGRGDQFSMLKALELSESTQYRLWQHAHSIGIEIMSSPFDIAAARFLVGLGMRRIKVPSGELTNLPYLKKLAEFDLPLIISTGMATLPEVDEAIETVRLARTNAGFKADLEGLVTLLHCTSNYPAALDDVNLRAMQTLKSKFALEVGYSDHTLGTFIAVAAVAMGANVIEKHFTLDRSFSGPDHQASLEPHELTRMVAEIRAVERSLGSGEKLPCKNELAVRDVVRRSVTIVQLVKSGEVLSSEHLALLRPGNGIPPGDLPAVLGRCANRDLEVGTTLQWADIKK